MPPGMGILMHELAAKAGLISDVGDCAAGTLSVEKGVSSRCWVLAAELQALVDLDLDVEITASPPPRSRSFAVRRELPSQARSMLG
jgi:hypothetical protein